MQRLLTFERDGYVLVPNLFSVAETHELIRIAEQQARPVAGRGGRRDVMTAAPELQNVAHDPRMINLANRLLGPSSFVVRATLFDKSPSANWKVPWHQDVTIAVAERRDHPGYDPWSVKQGVVHVQPPSSILQRMVTIRLHLDPCPAANGALRVMAGTHRLGKLALT